MSTRIAITIALFWLAPFSVGCGDDEADEAAAAGSGGAAAFTPVQGPDGALAGEPCGDDGSNQFACAGWDCCNTGEYRQSCTNGICNGAEATCSVSGCD